MFNVRQANSCCCNCQKNLAIIWRTVISSFKNFSS